MLNGPYRLAEGPRGRAVKLLSTVFLLVLLAMHGLAGAEAVALPLSMFRDGRLAVLGYLAFLCLIAIGPLMVWASWRSGELATAWFYGVGTGLLVYVAVTPSEAAGHSLCSLGLLLAFYVYYARMLLDDISLWVFPFLLVPGVLALVTLSFGPWQKSLIVFYLVVANIHYHLLAGTRDGDHRRWIWSTVC